jgi:hypothetical protein
LVIINENINKEKVTKNVANIIASVISYSLSNDILAIKNALDAVNIKRATNL